MSLFWTIVWALVFVFFVIPMVLAVLMWILAALAWVAAIITGTVFGTGGKP
jgi:hypothetical protein